MRDTFACCALLLLLGAPSLFGQSITDFTPRLGTNGDQITVIGSGFDGSTKVWFWNGSAHNAQAGAHVNASFQITVTNIPTAARTGTIAVQNGAGTKFPSSQIFTVVGPGPFITDFSPTYGSPNEPNILINGVHFLKTANVKFSGVSAAFTGTSDGQQLTATVPAGAALGTNFISVTTTNFGGSILGSFTSSVPFYVFGPGPFVTSFAPNSGPGGQQVIIQGGHFDPTKGHATGVNFNGKPGTGFFVNADSLLQVNAPNGVTTGPLTVLSGLGPSFNFTTTALFYGPPVITAFSPSSGRAGTNIVISGTNFTGASAVQFSGTGGPFSLSVSPTTVTSNSIQATAPVGVTNGLLKVVTPGGNFTTSSNFVVRPTIFSFTPGFGRPNTNVLVTGANFNDSGLVVKFGGVNAQSVNGVSFGQLTAVVPGTATNAPISVTTASGSDTSSQLFYLPPVITSFTPTNNAPGTITTISGQNLLGATNVSFGGVGFPIASHTNNTTLPVAVPNGVITGPIGVITPGGSNMSIALFYGAPAIFSFNPTHGLPGNNVTIFGTNFLGTSFVRFNGTNAGVSFLNNGRIDTAVPTGALTGPITVTAPAGVATSSIPFVLDFASDLVVTISDSPDPVFVGSNLVYTIVVTNLGPFAAPTAVLTNTLPGSVQLRSATTTLGTLNTNLNPITGALGTLAVSGAATITITVVPQTPGGISSTVTAASGYADPTPANASAAASTTVWPLPLLAIQVYTPTQIQLSWPAALTPPFVLQFNDDIMATNGWAAVPTPPFDVGNQKVVIESIGPATRYYRLKK